MKGYAKIFTDKVSVPTGPKREQVRESARRSTGESRLNELYRALEKGKVLYTAQFGLEPGVVEVFWGDHPGNVVEVDEEGS